MSTVQLEAETRVGQGKGASRRLRRLENKIPAILYGGNKDPITINLLHNKVVKALEVESIYSSVFNLKLDGKVENVILKAIQRHPYKPIIMHMDLQRVSAQDVLVRMIPLHFLHEEEAPGLKEGGMVNHIMTQVEVRCKAKDLPEFIEIDLKDMQLNDVLHLSDLQLPKGVALATDPKEGDHDHPVVGIHIQKVAVIEEEAPVAEEVEVEGAEGTEQQDTGTTESGAAEATEESPE